MKELNNEEQLALFKPAKADALKEYIAEGHCLCPQAELLMFSHPQADDLVITYLGSGHILQQESLLKVFNLSPLYAQMIMELCVAYDFPMSREVQMKFFELKYPKTILRRFIRQNKGQNLVDPEVYRKAKALHYV